ncbi:MULTISPECIES: hypothetical protein [unclassified Phenylobacterium]|uniref:hypothetical protein n=1 Tax=unclassified Phenylobacterium TaxID=2640670 RepID=UPI000A99EE59|nr:MULTISPECIES: hypothetical protein [unclassified Phenylobacterium]
MDDKLPLVRRGRRNARYTAISNDIIDHRTLSPDARIALIYLLSKPDDWQLQINDIRRLLGTGDRPCGRNKCYAVIKELKASSYVIAVEELCHGRFHRLTYYVFDEPLVDPAAFKAELRGERPACEAAAAQSKPGPNAPRPENRETVASPRPQIRDPGKRHLTKNRNIQTTEIPPTPPNGRRRTDERATDGSAAFLAFWGDWPERERPRQRDLAAKLFARLAADDQKTAVQFAGVYRAGRGHTREPKLMLPYLRQRLFAEFAGAPNTDGGRFVITPERPEWARWLDHLRSQHSAALVDRQAARGLFLTTTRWPPPPV